jgi:hypothetical protein
MNNEDSRSGAGRRLIRDDTFTFHCHPGVECFCRCCRDVDMYLYPYDIIRMKNRLGISTGHFLEQYTYYGFRDNPCFPSLMLKMSDTKEKPCPFLSQQGCTIYEDRPSSCRSYPVERAVARSSDGNEREVCYFITNHPYCLGHKEPRRWTIREWTKNQKIESYNEMNDLWVDVDSMFRTNPWGSEGVNSPNFNMAFTACFDTDRFRIFVLDSSFLSRFDMSKERIEQIKESDVDLMKLGFDWVRFFLRQSGPLKERVKTQGD